MNLQSILLQSKLGFSNDHNPILQFLSLWIGSMAWILNLYVAEQALSNFSMGSSQRVMFLVDEITFNLN